MNPLYTPPKIIRKIFSGFVWESKVNKILVTFDDGPNPNTTDKILKILEETGISALFFCVGNNVQKYGELAKAIISQNHEIGNHCFHHERIHTLSRTEFQATLLRTNEIIQETTGRRCNYFRPPHGKFSLGTNGVLREQKLSNVMWSLLTLDYKNDLKVVNFGLEKYLSSNAIVVFHDSNKSSQIICDSIKLLSDEVARNNYQFGTPSECLN